MGWSSGDTYWVSSPSTVSYSYSSYAPSYTSYSEVSYSRTYVSPAPSYSVYYSSTVPGYSSRTVYYSRPAFDSTSIREVWTIDSSTDVIDFGG